MLQRIELGNVRTEFSGFASVNRLNSLLNQFSQSRVVVDWSNVHWFDANMAAALKGILEMQLKNGVTVEFENIPRRIATILSKNEFLPEKVPDRFGTTIACRRFNSSDAIEFALYTEQRLMTHSMPKMSDGVRRSVLEGLDEIFSNAATHSKTGFGIHACGQAYPRTERLVFTVADFGIGIPATVRSVVSERISDSEAIVRAMEEGFTSKQLDLPGGLGLKVLKDFIQLNNGSLMVASELGFWEMRGHSIMARDFIHPFPGTAVTIEINTADRSSYRLKGEIDPSSIL